RVDVRRSAANGRDDAAKTVRPLVTLAGETLDTAASLVGVVEDRGLAQSLFGVIELDREQLAAAHASAVYVDFLATGNTSSFGEWVVAWAEETRREESFLAGATGAERAAFAAARSGDAPTDPARPGDPNDAVVPSAFPVAPVSAARYVDA